MKKNIVTFIALALCAALLISACTTDPNTGAVRPNKTGLGVMIGAAGGALAGVLVGGNRRGAIIGAGVGAIAGGAIGNYMDKQEKALKDATEGTDIDVERVGDQIYVDMPSEVLFDFDSSALKPEFQPILDRVAQVLVDNPKTYVDVYGHTDSVGSEEYNQKLSEERARSVAYGLERRGVLPERLMTRGFGETQPIASNDTADGRAQNRRVEIILTPLS